MARSSIWLAQIPGTQLFLRSTSPLPWKASDSTLLEFPSSLPPGALPNIPHRVSRKLSALEPIHVISALSCSCSSGLNFR
jgi:hypothetical protein